jgi:hypothetical protein
MTNNSILKDQERMEKAIVKISIVPAAPQEPQKDGGLNNTHKSKREKRYKPRIKFDLNGF